MRKAIIAGTSIEDIINRPVRTYRTDYGDVDAAEDGDVIQLGADIAVTKSLQFDGDGTVTLDLNGHTPFLSAFFLQA